MPQYLVQVECLSRASKRFALEARDFHRACALAEHAVGAQLPAITQAAGWVRDAGVYYEVQLVVPLEEARDFGLTPTAPPLVLPEPV